MVDKNYWREYYRKNKKMVYARNKKWRDNNKEKIKPPNRNLLYIKKYGITISEYEIMVEKQCGVCAICGGKDKDRRLSVDHDHSSLKVRGLLCHSCNLGLGKFKDDIHLLIRAIAYLELKD